jgi:hypothetical protein
MKKETKNYKQKSRMKVIKNYRKLRLLFNSSLKVLNKYKEKLILKKGNFLYTKERKLF